MGKHKHSRAGWLPVLLAILLGPGTVKGVALYTDDFESGQDGWTGAGAWTVFQNAGDERLQGDFSGQADPPAVEFGYWISPVIGDLTQTNTYTLTQLVFDFYAVNFAPSSLTLTIGSGANFITRAITGMAPGANLGVTVNLLSVAGWGGSIAQFSSILSNIDYVEFEVVRAAVTNAQSFQLDNFQIYGDDDIPAPSAIPEPGVLNTMLLLLLLGLAMRRTLKARMAT